jgi:hypothetical protein
MEAKTLKVGDKIMYRGSFGRGFPESVKIEGIELCEEGEKYGVQVDEILWSLKDRCVFNLDNGKWAYGTQIDSRITYRKEAQSA